MFVTVAEKPCHQTANFVMAVARALPQNNQILPVRLFLRSAFRWRWRKIFRWQSHPKSRKKLFFKSDPLFTQLEQRMQSLPWAVF